MLAAAVILLGMVALFGGASLCALCAILVEVKRIATPVAPQSVTFEPTWVDMSAPPGPTAQRFIASAMKRAQQRGLA